MAMPEKKLPGASIESPVCRLPLSGVRESPVPRQIQSEPAHQVFGSYVVDGHLPGKKHSFKHMGPIV